MDVRTIPALGDNLIYLLVEGGAAAVVDPGEAQPVREALSRLGVRLELILVTHTHPDHTGGCGELRRQTGCRVLGPAGVAGLDAETEDGETVAFADARLDVIGVPGHTLTHVVYYDPGAGVVFTGDTLFAGGCGRIIGASAARMWESLLRLRALPEWTRVYGGHDYALENMAFAAELEPSNVAVRRRLEDERRRGGAHELLGSTTVAEEKQTNPFLRCDDPALAQAVGMPGLPAAAVFAEIRGRKDRFRF